MSQTFARRPRANTWHIVARRNKSGTLTTLCKTRLIAFELVYDQPERGRCKACQKSEEYQKRVRTSQAERGEHLIFMSPRMTFDQAETYAEFCEANGPNRTAELRRGRGASKFPYYVVVFEGENPK